MAPMQVLGIFYFIKVDVGLTSIEGLGVRRLGIHFKPGVATKTSARNHTRRDNNNITGPIELATPPVRAEELGEFASAVDVEEAGARVCLERVSDLA